MRIEDKRGAGALMLQPEEQMINQGGFPGSGFPGEQHQALPALNTIGQFIKSAAGLRREVKIRRVRVYVEWIFFQPEKGLIHEGITQFGLTLGPGDVRAGQPGPYCPIICGAWEVGISCSTELLSLAEGFGDRVMVGGPQSVRRWE